MTGTTVLRLRDRDIAVDDTMRAAILDEMPEIAWIGDAALRAKVLDAWAAAVASAGFARIGDMKPSGNYDGLPLRHGTQADHIRSVARMALKIAEEMDTLFPDFVYDRDLLIAGALCHDIGKVWEFDPDNIARWKANPRKSGYPSMRHPGYGIHICLTAGLPEEVAHMAAAHSAEGELLTRSLENTILRWADHTFWMVAEAGAMLAETDDWTAPNKTA
ncbi:HD domain-containing protein [Jiella sonneratiae]|uniref:HD domain-containing protein n=1 Tax=Jiella sonneratiae TaxID=2816856 RepID=A0ABS3J8U4_9HYPH|nr:HD domain-containing protein [Jiella sonneratiae]MBO0906094.1 HD domain-containing protein [Jiella sonneratiae]